MMSSVIITLTWLAKSWGKESCRDIAAGVDTNNRQLRRINIVENLRIGDVGAATFIEVAVDPTFSRIIWLQCMLLKIEIESYGHDRQSGSLR